MSLIPFHRGLISIAIAFCFGYGVWELVAYGRTGSTGALVIGSVFLVLGVSLGFYLARLRRFLGYEARNDESAGP